MKKKLKILVSLLLLLVVIFVVGLVLKNLFLQQIRQKIQANLYYSKIRFSVFPLALVLDDVQSFTLSPFFSAKKVSVRVSYRSLLSKEKPIQIMIDQLVLKLGPSPGEKREGEVKFPLPLPFDVEKGLIGESEVDFVWQGGRIRAQGIQAQFTQRKGLLSVDVDIEENVISLGNPGKEIRGKMSLAVEGNTDELRIKKIHFSNPEFTARAEGAIHSLLDPRLELKTSIDVETALIARLFDLPFEWDGRVRGEGTFSNAGEQVSFASTLSSQNLILNEVPIGRVWGKVEVGNAGIGSVEFNMQKGSLPEEYIKIDFTPKGLEGFGRGFHLDPVIKAVNIPWPLKSPVWGTFTMDKTGLNADLEFREQDFGVVSAKYPLSGRAKFFWDGKNDISFSSQGLQSSFVLVDVEGKLTINQDIDIKIQGDVFDVKQARHFTSLILNEDLKIPEIRGQGRANLRIFGDFSSPQVTAGFTLPQAGFDAFLFRSVEGEVEIGEDIFLGRFIVDDPVLKGEVTVISRKDDLSVSVDVEKGSVEEILPELKIQFPLFGETWGRFEIKQKGKDLKVEGAFSSPELRISNQPLSQVKGKLLWKDDVLSFPELEFQFYGGKLEGSGRFGILSNEFKLDVKGEGLNLSLLLASLKGEASVELKGEGMLGQDSASGVFEVKDFVYSPLQKTGIKGELKFGIVGNNLLLDLKGNFLPGENEFSASLGFPLEKNLISADIKGVFRNLDLLIPWKGAKGAVQYMAEVSGMRTSPQIKGAVDFQGSVFPLAKFPQALRDVKALLFIENSTLSLRSFKATLGGGEVLGSGEIVLGKQGIDSMDIKIEGKNLLLSPLERTQVLLDGNLNLKKNETRFVLGGDVFIERLYWRREFTEKISFSTSTYYEQRAEPGIFDNLALDIRLRANDNVWMENSMGKIQGKFDLSLMGNVQHPALTGEVEVMDGDFVFQDRKFTVLKGRISFINPLVIEPYLDFKAETYVKDYRVTFLLNGSLARLTPEFSSSPPLPPEDVLALLAMGEVFKRTYSYDKSTQFSTASLLSFQIVEEAKRRAEKIFFIDRFRIDPFIKGSSAETTARLTVGKKISKNFSLVYSTNLSAEREELVRVEWELTKDFSIIGIRDEEGRLSFDVKIHKRF